MLLVATSRSPQHYSLIHLNLWEISCCLSILVMNQSMILSWTFQYWCFQDLRKGTQSFSGLFVSYKRSEGEWEGSPKEDIIYTCSWFTSLYSKKLMQVHKNNYKPAIIKRCLKGLCTFQVAFHQRVLWLPVIFYSLLSN